MSLQRLAVGLLLALIPFAAVQWTKQTGWGAVLASPAARRKGAPAAKLTIVEYSDFQCPSCARSQEPLHHLMEMYAGRVQLAFKYFPLTRIHPNSMPAARAADCAAAQNKFWPYQDQLFQRQLAWAPLQDPTTSFVAIAKDVQLDGKAFDLCFADASRTSAIEADIAEGQRREVNSTPTFFIGETRVVGHGPLEADGARVVEKELR